MLGGDGDLQAVVRYHASSLFPGSVVLVDLSSKDNLLADHLSRGREEAFLRDAEATGFWHADATQDAYVHRHPEAGTVRTYEGFAHMACVDSHVASSAWDPEMHGVYGAAVTPPLLPPDAPPGDVRPVHRAHVPQPRWGAAGRAFFMMCAVLSCSEVSAVGGTSAVSAQAVSVPYSRSMLFDGLPTELVPRLQDVLDVRLSASSMRSVNSALKHWRVVAERYDWPALIETDDRVRGAKLVNHLCWRSWTMGIWCIRRSPTMFGAYGSGISFSTKPIQ